MAENHDEIGFREMDNKFLLVTDIDVNFPNLGTNSMLVT